MQTQTKLTIGFFVTAFVLFITTYISTPAYAEMSIPSPNHASRVMDLTGTLSSSEILNLNHASDVVEKTKGTVVLTLLVPSLIDESIEEFANRVISSWRPGVGGNAVLVLIAKNDKKIRIEVGNGAQEYVTDAASKKILSGAKTFFKESNFAGGLSFITMSIGNLIPIKGAVLSPPSAPSDNTPLYILLSVLGIAGGLWWTLLGLRKKAEAEQERLQKEADAALKASQRRFAEDLMRSKQERELGDVMAAIHKGEYKPKPVVKPIPSTSNYDKKIHKSVYTHTPRRSENTPKNRRDDTSSSDLTATLYGAAVASSSSYSRDSDSDSSSRSSSSSSSSSWVSSSSSSDYSGGGASDSGSSGGWD